MGVDLVGDDDDEFAEKIDPPWVCEEGNLPRSTVNRLLP